MVMDDSNEQNVLVQCDFEVFGHVQGRVRDEATHCAKIIDSSHKFAYSTLGVGFTKFCHDNCMNAGIRGWVKNSKKGTIVGKMQGPKPEVDKM